MKRSIAALAAAAFLACIALGIASAQTTGTGTATWSWSAPTQYTDGSAIPSTTAITYNLYLGTAGPGSEAATPAQTGITALTATSSGYSAGENVCGTLTAVANGQESAHSSEACKAFPAVPKAPAALAVK